MCVQARCAPGSAQRGSPHNARARPLHPAHMRTWHLLLLLTFVVSVFLILREAPLAGSTPRLSSRTGYQAATELPPSSSPPPSRSAALSTPEVEAARQDSAPRRTSSGSGSAGIGNELGVSTTNASRSTVTTVVSVPWPGTQPPFIVLGVVSNCMWGNSFDRRKWIRETWKTYRNVGKTMHVIFVVAMRQSNLSPVPVDVERRLRQEALEHGDMLLLEQVPERKSPCLKTMAWFRHAARSYPGATFIAKTDDDAFVQTIKLEANMRPFASNPDVYIGSTLWGSYITNTFEACARRMGPNMCVGGMKEEKCVERGAIGPYPYAVGMLQVLSHSLATWMVEQPNFAEFERRATAETGTKKRPDGSPLIMDHGEDMVIGMFLYSSPKPLMPLHWGWDKLHDLCFKCTRKDQIWRPITTQTVVAHHVANEDIIRAVFHNITHGSHFDPRPCGDACQQQLLPFEVKDLRDLCGRGSIRNIYSKCKMLAK